jgi:tRNA threonylcarbamoyladenosine biosynthesis protein TsaB
MPVNGQRSTANGQRSTANGQRSTVNGQRPTVNCQLSTVNCLLSTMILLIDTSQETGIVALSKAGEVLFSEENKIQKEHATWLHPAVKRLIAGAKISLRDLEAVAVIAGPGSYTGLRVGMAAAKGFCYGLKIPLITQNTLRVMAESMLSFAAEKAALICPMIDARREEVFTALYQLSTVNSQLSTENGQRPTVNPPSPAKAGSGGQSGQRPTVNGQLLAPQAMILDKNSFETELSSRLIVFFGSGAAKWEKISSSPAAIFQPQPNIIQAFAELAQQEFASGNWADAVYAEPVYLKEFFTY